MRTYHSSREGLQQFRGVLVSRRGRRDPLGNKRRGPVPQAPPGLLFGFWVSQGRQLHDNE